MDRIREVNPVLNSVVDERFEEAIREARQVDQQQRDHEYSQEQLDELAKTKPFLGVPFTIKDCYSVTGKTLLGK